MKKLLLILIAMMLHFSCAKEKVNIDNIKGTMDLKGLSLPQLKAFLNGKWRLHRFVHGTIAGAFYEKVPDDVRVYLTFYPVDSVKWETTLTNVVIREKLTYERLEIPGDPNLKKAYVLNSGSGYLLDCVADSLRNDTLIFTNYFQSEGLNRYYYTKE